MIIVNADDFGLSESVNKAIIKAFEEGIISSTTIMANMPMFEEAVKLAYENGIQDSIGLHFNLMEGIPLSNSIKKCSRICSDGIHFSYKRNSVFRWTKEEKDAIREEFKSQYNRVIETGITPTHLDSHLHVHTEIPIYLIIKDLIKELGIKKIRKSRNLGVSFKTWPYKFVINSLFKIDNLKTTKFFSGYESSNIDDDIELMCHPTISTSNGNIIDAMTGDILQKKYNCIISYKDL